MNQTFQKIVGGVLAEALPSLKPETVVISIAAGVTLYELRDAVQGRCHVVRVMPNTPALVGAGVFGIQEDPALPKDVFGMILDLFGLLGSTIVDVIFGTLATLLACLVTYRLRNIRFKGLAIVPSLPPVLFNAVIIGIEIAVMFPDPTSSAPIWLACITNGISVGIGELISCTVLGVLLVKIIESNTALSQIFGAE